MKKVWIFLALLVLGALVTACNPGNINPPVRERTILPIEGSEVPYLDGGYVNVWADEFDGETLDLAKWNYEINASGGGNQEVQYYTGSNAIVSDGTLKIIAKQENFGNRQYTSSRIQTRFKGVFKYGKFQARLKLPRVTGLWPAFWMMPMHSVYGGWPHSGEIDIMEYVGRNPGKVFSALHTRKYNHQANQGLGFTYDVPNETEFHVYELEWLPGEMIIRVDDEIKAQFRYMPGLNQDVPYHHVWPFEQEFFMILNLAVGGLFGGNNIDNSGLPAEYEIDYIRVYQIDAPYVDTGSPSHPININTMNQLPNSIYWNASSDDTGVAFYEIFVDGAHHANAPLHQHTFSGLTGGQTYQITIRAVDLAGNQSQFSEPFSFTFAS